MHLTSYPKLVRSELRLDAVGVQTLNQQAALLRTCSSNHGNISSSRLPLSCISTNTLRRSNGTNGGGVASQLLPPPSGCENDSLRLYQTAAEDGDTPLDIWTVIKPGHVREKIAIFASDGGRSDGAGDAEHGSTGGPAGRDRTAAACTNHGATLRAAKAKGSWEENGSAKRRRRSGHNLNLQQDQRARVLDAQKHAHKQPPRRPGGEELTAEEEEQKVSVVEMVAFLEQRVSEQQPDSKPQLTLQRSSTTITLSRAPPPEPRGEEPETVRVSDMVAKLESECLKRRTEGELSRSNSLRRTVGRVLLATGDQSPAPGDQSPAPSPPSPPPPVTSSSSASPLPGARRDPTRTETPASVLATPPSPGLVTPPSPSSGEAAVNAQETPPPAQTTPPPREEAEPLPGLLFLSPPPSSETLPHTDSEPRPLHHKMTFDPEPAPPQPQPRPARSDSSSQSEKRRRRRRADRAQEEEAAAAAAGRRAAASQDFLEMRQRLAQLLEPQPYLAVLPHHLLLKILTLLPTQSLAALKCTCHYFKFIIDTYGVRPADSLWVSDPRYRDDPCKQCKKRYGRGDVSLCRWHHKPYCQALPYGPGYWMCCHGAHRDAPGCNVGLHDNRWVPAFHSITVPIYRRSRDDR